MKIITTVVLINFLLAGQIKSAGAQNLLYNGSAEITVRDSFPAGWTPIVGNWKSTVDTNGNYAPPEQGNRLFCAGKDSLGVLQQEVNIFSYSMPIDDKRISIIFRGFVRSFNQNPPDQSRILVQCLGLSKTKVLFEFDSDTISSIGSWKEVVDSFLAPVGTLFIRIQLIATRRSGIENDGYFDDLSLYLVKTPYIGRKLKGNKGNVPSKPKVENQAQILMAQSELEEKKAANAKAEEARSRATEAEMRARIDSIITRLNAIKDLTKAGYSRKEIIKLLGT